MNPVNFDSVFNESRHTWSFGSPDILPMFAHGATDKTKVDTFMYDEEMEDFTKEGSLMDTWVFDEFEALLKKSESDPVLKASLHSDKIVFFLHLLGIDHTGHSYRPYSQEYLDNIKVVDDGIKKLTAMIERYYNHDGKTSYIFTADHGMSNRGNHGDGHPDNTRTPLIAWGSGIAKPDKTVPTQGHDSFSAVWDLSSVSRHDVKQADIAPLMSSLIGIPFPMNSVGELPLAYLDNSPEFKARGALVNALGILEQYRVKEQSKRAHEIMFQPYDRLSASSQSPESWIGTIQGLINTGRYQEAELKCVELIEICLEGLRYLQTYDWLFLRSIVTAGYVGWIAFSFLYVLQAYVYRIDGDVSASELPIKGAGFALAILFTILFIQNSPWTYYAYATFPIFFWAQVARSWKGVYHAWVNDNSQSNGGQHKWMTLIARTAIGIVVLEAFVFGYFRRSVFSVLFIVGAFWPLLTPAAFQKENQRLLVAWSLACCATSVFTVLPVEKGENLFLVMAGGAAFAVTGTWIVRSADNIFGNTIAKGQHLSSFKRLLTAQVALTIISMIVTFDSATRLQAKTGLPPLNQAAGWAILLVSSALPFIYGIHPDQHYLQRLITVTTAFAPVFVILSISYECLFFYSFSLTLSFWMEIESRLYESSKEPEVRTNGHATDKPMTEYRPLAARDLRTSFIFLFFIQVGFFGTGNVASISSFSLESVYRLIPIFNPFLMSVLLLYKILLPFLIVSANLGLLHIRLGVAPFSLFLAVLSVGDIMTLNFFYLVRDDGSWLEIGTSISHFTIGSLLVFFMIILYGISEALVRGISVPQGQGRSTTKTSQNNSRRKVSKAA